MADDVFDAAANLKQRTASIDDKLDRVLDEQPSSAKTPVPAPGGTNFAQAKRSERKGSEGERAFGSPLARPEISGEQRAAAIRAAQEARIAELNQNAARQKTAQSTDLAN